MKSARKTFTDWQAFLESMLLPLAITKELSMEKAYILFFR